MVGGGDLYEDGGVGGDGGGSMGWGYNIVNVCYLW